MALELKQASVQAEPARGVAAGAVALVSGHRAAARGELGAYLVLAPRIQLKLHEAERGAALEHPIAAQGTLGGPLRAFVALPAHAYPAYAALDKPIVHEALIVGQAAFHKGHVTPAEHELVPRRHELGLRAGVGGKHHDAGGVPVQAVHDGRPALGIADAYALGNQAQRIGGPASFRRYGRQARRLVDDDELVAFIYDIDARGPHMTAFTQGSAPSAA
jgi:hypothetical protein